MKGTIKRTRGGGSVSPGDVKACGLCGSLNLRANRECFTCGWAGAFSADVSAVDAAWRRLELEYGAVQREHVSGSLPPVLSGFEIAPDVPATPPPDWRARLARVTRWFWPGA